MVVGGGGAYIVGVVQAEVKKSLNIYRTLKWNEMDKCPGL